MAQDVLTARLRRTALFEGLTPIQISEIARHAERVMYRPGDTVTVRGESSQQAIVIIEGELDCIEGSGLAAEEIGERSGTVLAEMAMFIDDFQHAATFKARSLTKALLINRRAMLRQMADDPAMAEHLVGKVSARLSHIVDELRKIEAGLGQSTITAQTLANSTAPGARNFS